MKICSYCGKVLKEAATECPSCGALEFKYKCEKCGAIYQSGPCPVCTGKNENQDKLQQKEEKDAAATSEKGYDPEVKQENSKKVRERQEDKGEAQTKPDHNIKSRIKPYNSEKTQTEPSGRTADVRRPGKKKKSWRAALLRIGVLIFCTFFIIKIYQYHTSDWRMCMKDGHPTIFDDYYEAKKFWEGNKKAAVVTQYETSEYKDPVIELLCSENELYSNETEKLHRKINSVTLDFSESKGKEEICLEDMLEVVRNYIPWDIVDNYYAYQTSFVETYDGITDYEKYHYVWKLKDAGIEQKKNGKTELQEKFGFEIYHLSEYWQIYIGSTHSIIEGDTLNQNKRMKKNPWNIEL